MISYFEGHVRLLGAVDDKALGALRDEILSNDQLWDIASRMIANICPGGVIGKHIGEHASADVPHKIHMPTKTDKSVYFIQEDSACNLQYGFAYDVNNKIMHGVMKKSANERIHLIFDYYDAAAS